MRLYGAPKGPAPLPMSISRAKSASGRGPAGVAISKDRKRSVAQFSRTLAVASGASCEPWFVVMWPTGVASAGVHMQCWERGLGWPLHWLGGVGRPVGR